MLDGSFSVGDVVTGKNDGVKMTIESAGIFLFGVRLTKVHVVCVWFVGSELHREVFPVDSLIAEKQVGSCLVDDEDVIARLNSKLDGVLELIKQIAGRISGPPVL